MGAMWAGEYGALVDEAEGERRRPLLRLARCRGMKRCSGNIAEVKVKVVEMINIVERPAQCEVKQAQVEAEMDGRKGTFRRS